MPKTGYTCLTVSESLKERLNAKVEELGYTGVPSLIEDMLRNSTSTVTSTKKTQNTLDFGMWSLRRDLDPRPLPYQGNAPPG